LEVGTALMGIQTIILESGESLLLSRVFYTDLLLIRWFFTAAIIHILNLLFGRFNISFYKLNLTFRLLYAPSLCTVLLHHPYWFI
jgi:hypothetical protein